MDEELEHDVPTQTESQHASVLLHEAIESLQLTPTDVVVDGTIGGAGHFGLLLGMLSEKGTLIGIDADEDAIGRARNAVETAQQLAPRIILANDNFRNLGNILDQQGIATINKSLFDLGWSGYQLTRGRGFSFQTEEPLYMTYGDPETQQTAEDVVNGLPEEELANVLYELGEETFSRKIAHTIAEIRRTNRITTTTQLVDAIKAGTPTWYHSKRLHPATKTFQALRMYVNDELGALQDVLATAIERTAPEGRIAVITFHSIEDRVVKNIFRDAVQEGTGLLVFKKPLIPSSEELSRNPRARSAKLRVFEKSTIE